MIIGLLKSASPLILLMCLSAAAHDEGLSAPPAQNQVSEINHQWTWRHRDNGVGLEVTVNGEAVFNDDYTDVIGISPGGSLRIKDGRGGRVRRLEIVPAPGGLKRSYYVDDRQQPYDDEAARWFVGVLTEAVRRGGLDARKRAQRVLKQRGSLALLDEISGLQGDFVRRVYLEELIKGGGLNAEIARRILAEVARGISSDYEKVHILTTAAGGFLADEGVRSAYLEAVDTIVSDYEKARALSALLNKSDLGKEALLLTIKSAARISSDYEKAGVLIRAAKINPGDEAVRAALVQTANTIRSEYERGRVLNAVFSK